MNQEQISLYKSAKDNKGSTITVQQAIDMVLKDKATKNTTDQYRTLQPGKQKDNFKKMYFAGITWSGVFAPATVIKDSDEIKALSLFLKGELTWKDIKAKKLYWERSRNADQVQQHSGHICLDIDHLANPTQLKERLINDPYVKFCFISPGGEGIKPVVQIDMRKAVTLQSIKDTHLQYFKALENYFLKTYGQVVDPSGKDISRLCFLPNDSYAHLNNNADVCGYSFLGEWLPRQNAPEPAPAPRPAATELKGFETNLTQQDQQRLSGTVGEDYNDVYEFTQRLYNYTDGSRNVFVFQFGLNCARKGLDESGALQSALEFATGLDAKEVTATIKSSFNTIHNAGEFGKYAKKVPHAGAGTKTTDKKEVAKRNSHGPAGEVQGQGVHAGNGTANGAQAVNGNRPADNGTAGEDDFIEFWHVEKDEDTGKIKKYSLDYIKYFDFLQAQGFHRLPLENNTFDLIHFRDNICKPVMPHNIQDHLNHWCKDHSELGVLSMLRKGAKTYFAAPQFINLEYKNVEFARDTKDNAYFYFQNGIAEVSKAGIQFHEYRNHNKSIWESQIIKHEFKPELQKLLLSPYEDMSLVFDKPDSVFTQFISRVCSNPKNKEVDTDIHEERFFSHCSAIGYMLHDYKSSSLAKAVIAVDHKMSMDRAEQNGGTGKSIVGNSFQYMKKTAMIDGREFKEDYPFRFDMLETDTKIIVMGDCRHSLDFGTFFVPITGNFTYNRRNVGFRTIKFADSPKFWFDTNFTFKGEGNSHRRRQHVIEFDDYYHEDFTPLDDFGHTLFTDWDAAEMNRFYNFMLWTVHLYLSNGLISYPGGHYDERKLVNECPQDFLDFLDAQDTTNAYKIARNKEYEKIYLLKEWNDHARNLNMTITNAWQFTKWFKKYCRARGFEPYSRKSNGTEWISIGAPQAPVQQGKLL